MDVQQWGKPYRIQPTLTPCCISIFKFTVNVYFVHTYSDIHRLPWRDDMSRQCGEGKSGGGVFLDIYILHLYLFWRHSVGSTIKIIEFKQPAVYCWVHALARVSHLLPVDIHTDLTRIDDGWVSIQLFVCQQSTLNIVYPSEKKIWDFFLRKTHNIYLIW